MFSTSPGHVEMQIKEQCRAGCRDHEIRQMSAAPGGLLSPAANPFILVERGSFSKENRQVLVPKRRATEMDESKLMNNMQPVQFFP